MKGAQARNLSGFISIVDGLIEKWTPKNVDWYLQLWFRGHANKDWELKPGLHRSEDNSAGPGDEYYNEGQLMETFKLKAPTYLQRQPSSDWEWLFVMQHYGLRTRLLDWTESSLIALYFAVRDSTGDADACVWVMNPWWLNYHTFNDYVLFAADNAKAKNYGPLKPKQKLKGKLPIAITPIHSSSRIVAQRGVFTIHGTKNKSLDKLTGLKHNVQTCLCRIIIPRDDIERIRRELSVSGITETLIFPELDGLCREIKRDFFGVK